MTNYGIRGSQAGIPLSQVADYQETMDERWPVVEFAYMDIIELKNVQVPAVTVFYIPLYQHALTYLPAFFLKGISDSSIEMNAVADAQTIYLPYYAYGTAVTIPSIKFFVAVLDRDISQTFQAPIDTPAAVSASTSSPYGLKIQPEPSGQGMDDNDKSLFSFNSNAKPMSIQAHGLKDVETAGADIGKLLITHKLGYPPTYYVAKRYTNNLTNDPMVGKTFVQPLGSGSGIATSDSLTLKIRGAQAVLGGTYQYIILKDPVDTAA